MLEKRELKVWVGMLPSFPRLAECFAFAGLAISSGSAGGTETSQMREERRAEHLVCARG